MLYMTVVQNKDKSHNYAIIIYGCEYYDAHHYEVMNRDCVLRIDMQHYDVIIYGCVITIDTMIHIMHIEQQTLWCATTMMLK